MRKLILTATAFLCLAGGSYFLTDTWGKDAVDEAPHRIGLIDIGQVLSKYEKLKYRGAELQAEVEETRAQFKAQVKKFQEDQAMLKDLVEGTPDFAACEARVAKKGSELETKEKLTQLEFKRKQAKILHESYLEMQDAIEKFCTQFKFTVIIRFERADGTINDLNKVNKLLGQPVVYHRKKDDLTDGVVKYLNERFLATPEGQPKQVENEKPAKRDSKIKPAGATKTAD